MSIALIGLPGSGKSSVGAAVAQQLGLSFVDTDVLITTTTNRGAAEFLRDVGEPAFREVERGALVEALRSYDLVATGGGVVTTPEARAELSRARCVWLAISVDDVIERLRDGDRPLLDGDVRERVTMLAQSRDPLYAELASAVVDASRPFDEVVQAVVTILGEWST